MSESAVRDKPLLVYGLARNRRSPKRPVRAAAKRRPPGRGRSGKRWRSLPHLDFRGSAIAGIFEGHFVLLIGNGGAGRTLNCN